MIRFDHLSGLRVVVACEDMQPDLTGSPLARIDQMVPPIISRFKLDDFNFVPIFGVPIDDDATMTASLLVNVVFFVPNLRSTG